MKIIKQLFTILLSIIFVLPYTEVLVADDDTNPVNEEIIFV